MFLNTGLGRRWLEAGRQGLLPGKTYAPVPLSWAAAGQSREMLQFGEKRGTTQAASSLADQAASQGGDCFKRASDS
jgi:hypothetical protein